MKRPWRKIGSGLAQQSRCRYSNTARPLRDIRFDRQVTLLWRKRCVAAGKEHRSKLARCLQYTEAK
jgi:hypothetical protein